LTTHRHRTPLGNNYETLAWIPTEGV
jgi:hypothetical protein